MTTEGAQAPPKTRYVGESVPTRAAERVVAGTLEYLTDKYLPDMLYGAVVRTTAVHGRLEALRVDAARDVDGVVVVLTAQDVPENIEASSSPIGRSLSTLTFVSEATRSPL